jgi:hypothetical protein
MLTRRKFPWVYLAALLPLAPSVLLLSLYPLVNWYGSSSWAETKAKWEAKGIDFDPHHYRNITPIPPEENMVAISLFDEEKDPVSGQLEPINLVKCLHGTDSFSLRSLKTPQPKLVDRAKIREEVAALYKRLVNGQATEAIDELNEIFPESKELNESSSKRKGCQFAFHYIVPDIAQSDSINFSIINLVRFYCLHSLINLDDRKSDLAFIDLQIAFRLSVALQDDPSTISNASTSACLSYCVKVIASGLSDHLWTTGQKQSFQEQLISLDRLAQAKKVLQAELICARLPMLDYLKTESYDKDANTRAKDPYQIRYWPPGWIDLNKIPTADFILQAAETIDSSQHCVDASAAEALMNEKESAAYLPWRIIYAISVPFDMGIPLSNARSQVLVDQCYIACALDQYYQVNHHYPSALQDLVPAYAKSIPHDVFLGIPYHYSLNADGDYLLYSVGWNQKDDGGVVSSNRNEGDWVWPWKERIATSRRPSSVGEGGAKGERQ